MLREKIEKEGIFSQCNITDRNCLVFCDLQFLWKSAKWFLPYNSKFFWLFTHHSVLFVNNDKISVSCANTMKTWLMTMLYSSLLTVFYESKFCPLILHYCEKFPLCLSKARSTRCVVCIRDAWCIMIRASCVWKNVSNLSRCVIRSFVTSGSPFGW